MTRTILFLSAQPRDTAPLRIDEEIREIHDALSRSRHRDDLIMVTRTAVRPRDVRQALLAHRPAVLHFSGHGREQGVVLEDDDGQSLLVDGDVLAELLGLAICPRIECLVLNVCHSHRHTESLVRHIPFVIGMSHAVMDRAGIVFAGAFYEGLGNGESIPFAYELGCNAVRMSGLAMDRIAVLATQRMHGVSGARTRAVEPGRNPHADAPPAAALPPPSQEIADALHRKQRLEAAGLPIDEVLAEIRALKREHRSGVQLRAGDVLGNRYLLVEKIGHGGFGTVWRARDDVQREDVAIKVLHPNRAGDPEQLRRFFRGARIMAELAHPAVVPVREREAEDDGFYYFVMDYVPGGDLRRAVMDGRVTSDDTIPLLLRVGEALAAAHQRGYLHRDVKPTNILLTEQGLPLLTDFDLAAAADTTGGTRTGPLGTLVYAAPEMLERPQDADIRADVYGLGMTALFMYYGKDLPISVLRDTRSFLERLRCDQAIVGVLHRAVSWNVAERHADVAAFCHDLRSKQGSPEPRLVNDIAWVLASSRPLSGAALETARALEGVWMALGTGSVYCASLIEDRLIIPYSWGGTDVQTSVFYDCVISNDAINCHFGWLDADIQGHVSIKILSQDRLHGSWWYEDCDSSCKFPDGSPGSQSSEELLLQRLPDYPMPDWAIVYLRSPTFRKVGDRWQIWFEGGDVYYLRDSEGLAYIHVLLSNPDHQYTAIELRDHDYRLALSTQVLQRQRARFERARKAVSTALHYTLQIIALIHPAFAAHLRASLHIGDDLCYAPPEPMTWRT